MEDKNMNMNIRKGWDERIYIEEVESFYGVNERNCSYLMVSVEKLVKWQSRTMKKPLFINPFSSPPCFPTTHKRSKPLKPYNLNPKILKHT